MPSRRPDIETAVACGTVDQCPLGERALLGASSASELAGTFKVLASDTRLRLLHALVRTGELCVSDLAVELGMAPQAVSNQLQRLADRRIVATRRNGNRIFYRVIDPCVPQLLELGLCLSEESAAPEVVAATTR